MKKENIVKSAVGEPTARITRARAAPYRQSKAMASKEQSKQQDEKLPPRTKSKRPALDETNENARACTRTKRRAELKDITNVFCDNSYKKCLNATKVPVCTLSFGLFLSTLSVD